MLRVLTEFDDGKIEVSADDFADLGEATAFAFQLADRLGKDPGDGNGPPQFVHIRYGGIDVLSIKVFPGGLLSQ